MQPQRACGTNAWAYGAPSVLAQVKGYKYGRDRVPFSKVDEAVLKYEAEKCLKVMGFVPQTEIPRHVFTEGTDCISLPCKSDEEQTELTKRAVCCAPMGPLHLPPPSLAALPCWMARPQFTAYTAAGDGAQHACPRYVQPEEGE